ncbi:hypothetical protein NLU13_6884 [Sarocladium strictum]|uniref:Calpain catalytic domain-containing protein n=1 Tax=Sarocladium strictum TaxID=5046 RepID=A0AA39GGK0_SARSR|nr:hypothetical protein NLU13_6884 [Sarocladium strictum]
MSMEKRAQAAETLSVRSAGQEALDHAIQAAELYMRAASETKEKGRATVLRRKCKDLIARAEALKSTLSAASCGANAIIQRASHLHGNDFPPWDSEPSKDEFRTEPGVSAYRDDASFSLSLAQEAILDDWKRPEEIFADKKPADTSRFMDSTQGCDLVQDVTTDCSVVASLSAALNILTGKRSVLSSVIYPFDYRNGLPELSQSGKYVLRMHFNGCARRVTIDDRLPASRTDRTLFVVDRQNPMLIWPALVEKAYLKVRGGYDFPGSNSGTDLWVITGWIPEQMWTRIKGAHENDDVVITLGTGRISPEEEEATGLIGEHDYAVMSLDDASGSRWLTLKNPWCNGPPWAGSSTLNMPVNPTGPRTNTTFPGLQRMTMEEVVQNFESLYLNWNPELFPHRQNHHFAWDLPRGPFAASLIRNPQYCVTSSAGGPIWVLVSRHFVDSDLEIARRKPDSPTTDHRQLGFMSLLIFDNKGKRVQLGDGELYRSPYIDSPQTLARLDAAPGTAYTVVVDQHELPLPSYTFTLSLFSHEPLQVEQANESMAYQIEKSGSWRRRTAGGSVASSTYHVNPQYKLDIPRETPLTILLATSAQDIPVHLDLVWANGERVHHIQVRDLVGTSGDYRRGCALATVPSVDQGSYTLVCSTFEAGQIADFCLRVSSMVPLKIDPVPSDGAGRMRTPLPSVTFTEGEQRKRARINISWLTRANVSMYCADDHRAEYGVRISSGLMIRLFVAFGWGPHQTIIANAGEGGFQEVTAALRTLDFDMEPDRAQEQGLWLVIECMGNHTVETPCLEGELFSDAPIHIGPWETA